VKQGGADIRIVRRIIGAHILGLYGVGVLGTIGTSAGFDIFGGWLGVWLGGIVSVPLIVPVLLLAAHFATIVDRHPVWFATCGPFVVGSIVALGLDVQAGGIVAASGGISSLFYLMMVAYGKRRERLGDSGHSD
jgi:hypothetical protein